MRPLAADRLQLHRVETWRLALSGAPFMPHSAPRRMPLPFLPLQPCSQAKIPCSTSPLSHVSNAPCNASYLHIMGGHCAEEVRIT